MGVINPAKYIQHNFAVADGPAGVAQLLKELPLRDRAYLGADSENAAELPAPSPAGPKSR